MARKKNIDEEAAKVLKLAEQKGLTQNYFFKTTFERYQVQRAILAELEKGIREYGNFCKKEYVKGRENIVINPAISEYNRTATAANNTVSALINIVRNMAAEEPPKNSRLEMLKDETDG